MRKLAQLAEEQLKRTTERVKALTVQLHRFIPTIYICIDTLMYCHHHLMYYVFIFNFLDDRLFFECELAPLAEVQVAGLEESEEEEGTFTKSLESCNNNVMGSLKLRLEAKA